MNMKHGGIVKLCHLSKIPLADKIKTRHLLELSIVYD